MKITRTLTAIALALGLAAPALAQGEYKLDADENNEITQEEWGAYGDQTFGEADADQGGYVDEEEYTTWATSNFGGEPGGGDDDGPLWGLLDTNDDAQVDEEEWFSDDVYGELDDDDSGGLGEDEFGVGT
jgi:predicted transcriptional regulator